MTIEEREGGVEDFANVVLKMKKKVKKTVSPISISLNMNDIAKDQE